MQELHRVLNMWQYAWICLNLRGSEYVSYNTKREVTLEVNENLLRERHIQKPVKYLGWSALEK